MRQLILVHGRSQQQKDGGELKKAWIEAWEKGLEKSGLTSPITDADIHFPYYGDTLAQMVDGKSAEQAADVIIKGVTTPPPDEQQVMREMINEIALHQGVAEVDVIAALAPEVVKKGPQNWAWVQGILSLLDKVEPLSARLVALVTADVAKYLTNAAIQQEINDGVLKALKAGQDAVVVSHSLGTVVAYQVLMSRPSQFPTIPVKLFVTLGSPLAMNAIKSRVRPHTFPKPIGAWYNAMDPDDVVSLYPLSKKYFNTGGTIENHEAVDNWTDNQHGIAGYLDDAKVAKQIYDALTRP
jgi:hypothetical protein